MLWLINLWQLKLTLLDPGWKQTIVTAASLLLLTVTVTLVRHFKRYIGALRLVSLFTIDLFLCNICRLNFWQIFTFGTIGNTLYSNGDLWATIVCWQDAI